MLTPGQVEIGLRGRAGRRGEPPGLRLPLQVAALGGQLQALGAGLAFSNPQFPRLWNGGDWVLHPRSQEE